MFRDMWMSQQTSSVLEGGFRVVKSPAKVGRFQGTDESVRAKVSEMLLEIEKHGLDAVRKYALELDGWDREEFELGASELEASGARIPNALREAIDEGSARTKEFAQEQRSRLGDFEVELMSGVRAGVRYVPIQKVGAYLPAGRFPLTASAFMTVGVAKVAGVPSAIACSPPQPNGRANDAVTYAAFVSGVDRMFVLGGVQALASMAFGLLDGNPANMLVGAGNAFVAEAKRQLYGAVSIDILAGPSEVAVIADEGADPELVAADLLAQAEHGPNSPSALVTTSEEIALAVEKEIERQLEDLSTREIAGNAWREFGSIIVANDFEIAAQIMDDLAPEHLELHVKDVNKYHDRLTNYGSIFLGQWSTVAYSDKGMTGTNHVLPTAGGAKHSAGLSVGRFLKPLTFQEVSRDATRAVAPETIAISRSEHMEAHLRSAQIRLDRVHDES